jgi:ketosteroid isomerase-like protein
MRTAILVLSILLCSMAVLAQSAEANLQSELEALHAKWFKAFDGGDGATMDQLEAPDLTLVMPTGPIWHKTKARASEQLKPNPKAVRTLEDVSVRRFGDAAILTGVLNTKSGEENVSQATTVVFIQRSGRWLIASAQWTPVAEQ